MLSEPEFGWTDIEIGEFRDRASYLTDVPCDILRAIAETLYTRLPAQAVHIDAEGWEYYIIFSVDKTYIYLDGRRDEEFFEYIPIENLAREAVEDISSSIIAWSLWEGDDYCDFGGDFYVDMDEKQKEKMENSPKVLQLRSLISQIERLLKKENNNSEK